MVELTMTQRQVLETLVTLYEEKKRMIKSKEVARILGKDEGTVRNIIVWLKNVGLVESRTGPLGGYIPTLKARELLRKTYSHPIAYGVVKLGDKHERVLNIISMEILNLFSHESAKALVKVLGDTSFVEKGMKTRIESIPKPRFIAEGYVEKVDNAVRQILVRITNILSIPEVRVGDIARRNIIFLEGSQTLIEASKILSKHGIRGAPVKENNKLIGFFTASDLARAIARGLTPSDRVRDALSRRDIVTLNEQADIFDAISLMESQNVGRLVVVDSSNNPVGIITRTDILKLMTGLNR